MTAISLDRTNNRWGNIFHLLAIACFAFFLLYRVVLIFYPHPDAGGVEVNIIYFIQRLLDGQSLYTDPELAPYAIAQYSPLYYYLCTGVAKLFHVQPDEVLQVFIVSRCVSLLLNLLYMGMVFLTARNIFLVTPRRSFYAAVFAFIFLEITSFSRPDSLNHLFFLLSLYFFMKTIKNVEKKPGRDLFLAAVFAAIALFSKQSSFILPVMFLGWHLWQRQYKKIFFFGACYALAAASLLGTVLLVTDLNLFYKNVITGISNGISLGWFKGVILGDFYYGFGIVFLLLFITLCYVFKKESKTELLRFSFAALFFLFLFQNAVALKNGSNPGYFTEWWTLLFIVTAFYWSRLTGALSSRYAVIPIALLVLVLAAKVMLVAKPVYKMTIENPPGRIITYYQAEKEIARELLEKLEPRDKHVVFLNFFTADSYLGCLLFRHVAMPQMDIIVLAAYPQKTYNYSGFISRLKAGEFKWMLMRTNLPQKQFYDIRLNKYELEKTSAGFNIYHYKP